MPELKMLENVLKPKETATAHARKHFSWGLAQNWDENGQKGHLLLKSAINSKLVRCQRVNDDIGADVKNSLYAFGESKRDKLGSHWKWFQRDVFVKWKCSFVL